MEICEKSEKECGKFEKSRPKDCENSTEVCAKSFMAYKLYETLRSARKPAEKTVELCGRSAKVYEKSAEVRKISVELYEKLSRKLAEVSRSSEESLRMTD